LLSETRLHHVRGAIKEFLGRWKPGSPVAVETIGNWYWLVDEIEQAGMTPQLVHARKAKLMLGMINKTDRLDARGLNRLQRTGTLPTVWIPSRELRDARELPRTRMFLAAARTRLKNRLHATLAKYAITISDVNDLFGKRGRTILAERLALLPPHTRFTTEGLLEEIDHLDVLISDLEERIRQTCQQAPETAWLRSLPGVGYILAQVIWLEVGDVSRFPDAEHLAAYAGTTPRLDESGGKKRAGRLRRDVNHYLKWAFLEAAIVVCLHQRHWPKRHIVQLYQRVARRRNHAKALGAVARHLAEATYWMLRKGEPYREPTMQHRRVHEGVSASNV
jgi:transposase